MWAYDKILEMSVRRMQKYILEDGYEPTEEEMRAYYDNNLEEFASSKPVRVQHIVFEDSATAAYVRELIQSGTDFMEMVDKYYPGDPDIKQTAANLGDIGPGDMPESFFRAAMATPVDKISQPVKTDYGYHIIKVLKRDYAKSFDVAKTRIRTYLISRHKDDIRREYVESRLNGAPDIYWEFLDSLYRKEINPDHARGN